MWRDFLSRLPTNISGANSVLEEANEQDMFEEPASENLWVPYLIVFILFLLIIVASVVLYMVYF